MIYVFVGPTLSAEEARKELDAVYLPPAAQGDVYRAARERPEAIGLIDGYFERVPAVWHKELLWAMAEGIHVYGSASMGALRAAELAPFGMRGFGATFEAFLHGDLEDDDEVAVMHAPAEEGYRPLSEAMVNIRATLASAERAEVRCSAFLKRSFFMDSKRARSRGGVVATSPSSMRFELWKISSTATSKASVFCFDGLRVPAIFRTNCSAAARMSSSVAGGEKLNRGLMLRHMPRG
jgi:hypothetical protein